jgi:hypothetical protein
VTSQQSAAPSPADRGREHREAVEREFCELIAGAHLGQHARLPEERELADRSV